jgi:hypothetical protein
MPMQIIAHPLVTRDVWPREDHDCPTPEIFPCACNEVGVTRTWPALAVRWQRSGETTPDDAGSAHVGITLTEYEQMPWPEYWERTSTVDRRTAEKVLPPVKEEHYSRTLTRAEINQLIATLRRARDGAYGRDE